MAQVFILRPIIIYKHLINVFIDFYTLSLNPND